MSEIVAKRLVEHLARRVCGHEEAADRQGSRARARGGRPHLASGAGAQPERRIVDAGGGLPQPD